MPKAITLEEFQKYLESTNNNDFKLTGNIITVGKTDVRKFELEDMRLPYIGKKFYMSFYHFKQGQRPQYEAYKNRSTKNILRGKESFLKFLESKKDEYELLSEYIGSKKNVLIKHKLCNRCFDILPYNLMQGEGCSYCGKETIVKKHIERMKTLVTPIEELKRRVFEQRGNEYEIIGASNHTNKNSKIEIMHHSTFGDHTFKMSVSNFINNKHNCPICKISNGELVIKDYLTNHKITFIREYKFLKCSGSFKSLRYDFFLPDYNIAIEYNGIQHYKSIEYFGGEGRLKKQKQYDKIKKQFCKDNGITLIVIPYTRYNKINEILEKQLSSTTIRKE